ncbi:hypothetical protein MMC29_001990, partial [Sticta canariensis]|nr:hypothetical protein [Sticta canariensis]
MHYKRFNIYRVAKKDWDNYHTVVSKLRGLIQGSIAKHKAAKLRVDLPVQIWLQKLKASTAPAKKAIQQSILVEY